MNEIPNGVIPDKRPIEKQRLDHLHIAGAVTPNWIEKETVKAYTQRFQNGSYSCVFQSSAKAL
jgi:hypothetical protein